MCMYVCMYLCIGFRVCLHAERHLVGVYVCVCVCMYNVCVHICIGFRVCLHAGRHLVGVRGVAQAAEGVGHRHQNVPLYVFMYVCMYMHT